MTIFDDQYLEDTLEKALGDPENFHIPMGITRYDYSKMHGWWVRVHRDEVQFQELFYDSQYPSAAESLRAAIYFRHEILSTLPLEKKIIGRPPKSLPKDPEKRIARRTEKGKQQPYICWQATWYDEHHEVQTKRFSVKKFGEDGARKLALEHATNLHNKTPKPIKEKPNNDPYRKQKFRRVSREDVSVLATIDSGRYRSKEKNEIEAENSNPFAFEGERKLELHMAVERDKKLRNQKVKEFLDKNEKIFCELCGFQFTQNYPWLTKDIIEVHHIIPLSQLSGKTKITLNDLMLLCSNCHLAIHQGDEEANLIFALDYFEKPS